MARLGLGQLQDALRNPAEFRRQMELAEGSSFGETYVSALRQTIFRYHRTGDRTEARTYLRDRLENSRRLRNASRIFETRDQLEWYIDEHERREWPTFQSPLRLVVPVRRGLTELTCSGEVARLDLVPTGGYAGWLFVNDSDDTWIRELRFPIIQAALASEVFGVPPSEIQVGIYDMSARRVSLTQYPPVQLVRARRTLRRLVTDLGF
jgi:hypothetical protein